MRFLPVLLTLCLLLAAPVPVHAEEDLPPEARLALVKAQALLDENRPGEAARVVEQYLAATAEAPPADAWLVLGIARHDAGDEAGALRAFSTGLKSHPDDPSLCLNSAVLLYQADQNKEAAPLFEKAYGLVEPKRPELLYQAGSAYYLAEDYAASARVLDRLVSATAKPEKQWIQLAVHAFLAAGNLDKAESMVLALLRQSPGDAAYWELLAKVDLDRERYAKAAAALEVCYRLRQPGARDLEQLADLYRYLGAPLRAAATLERAYGSPDAGQAARIAALYAASGRSDQAVRVLEKPGQSADTLLQKAKILFHARQFREAAQALDACLERAPGNSPVTAEARFYRGLCAWEAKEWDAARREFQRVARDKQYGRQASAALAALDDLALARQEAVGN